MQTDIQTRHFSLTEALCGQRAGRTVVREIQRQHTRLKQSEPYADDIKFNEL